MTRTEPASPDTPGGIATLAPLLLKAMLQWSTLRTEAHSDVLDAAHVVGLIGTNLRADRGQELLEARAVDGYLGAVGLEARVLVLELENEHLRDGSPRFDETREQRDKDISSLARLDEA